MSRVFRTSDISLHVYFSSVSQTGTSLPHVGDFQAIPPQTRVLRLRLSYSRINSEEKDRTCHEKVFHSLQNKMYKMSALAS